MWFEQEMMDLEFAICVTMPKIRAMEHKLSLALDDVQQAPCVRMRMDSMECTFKNTRVDVTSITEHYVIGSSCIPSPSAVCLLIHHYDVHT